MKFAVLLLGKTFLIFDVVVLWVGREGPMEVSRGAQGGLAMVPLASSPDSVALLRLIEPRQPSDTIGSHLPDGEKNKLNLETTPSLPSGHPR